MASETFTKGPWVVQSDAPTGYLYVVAGAWPTGETICDRPSKANATLIAAAPDMYEALTKLRSQYAAPLHYSGDLRHALVEADAALAKARGE